MNTDLLSQVDDDTTVLCWQGRLTADESGRAFRARVVELLKQYPTVIVDLSGVDYMDGRGLGILVGLYSTARTARSTLRYRNLVASVDYCQAVDAATSVSGSSYKLAKLDECRDVGWGVCFALPGHAQMAAATSTSLM
jgi:anti-anti-sigma factor